MASPFETYMKKMKRNQALGTNVMRPGGVMVYDQAAERKKIEDEYLASAPSYNQPTKFPDYNKIRQKEEQSRQDSQYRQNQSIKDAQIMGDAKIMSAFDQAHGLGGDKGLNAIYNIGKDNPYAVSVFDKMNEGKITFAELTENVANPKEFVKPWSPSATEITQMENLLNQGWMPDDIKANPAMAKVYNHYESRNLRRLGERNVDRMLQSEEDQIASDLRDKKYKAQQLADEQAYQEKMAAGPSLYYGPGINEKRMNQLSKWAVKYGDKDVMGLVQGLMGSDGIKDSDGVYGMLNMRANLKRHGASDEFLKEFDEMGHYARIGKMERNYEKEYGKPKSMQELLAERDNKRFDAMTKMEPLPVPENPRQGLIASTLNKMGLKTQLAGHKVAEGVKDAGGALMAGLSGKYDKNLKREINAQEGGGFLDLLNKSAQQVVDAGGQALDAGKKGWDSLGKGVKAVGDFVDDRYGDTAIKNRQADQEAYGTLSEMEGWGDLDQATKDKLANQRVQGLSDNEMYGEGEDQVDISGGEGLTKAGAIAGDVAKGVGVGLLGGAGLGVGAIGAGVAGLAKGAKGLYDKATAEDGFLGGERASYEDFKSGKSRGSFLQRLGKGMAGAGNIVEMANEDIPFSSLGQSDVQFGWKGGKKKKSTGYINDPSNVTSGATQNKPEDNMTPEQQQQMRDSIAVNQKVVKGVNDDGSVRSDASTSGGNTNILNQPGGPPISNEPPPDWMQNMIAKDQGPKTIEDIKAMDPDKIKEIQTQLGVTVDGKVGPETTGAWEAHIAKQNKQRGGFISGLMNYQMGGYI